MKRKLAILVSICCLTMLVFAACATDGTDTDTNTGTNNSTTSTITPVVNKTTTGTTGTDVTGT
ncbi:MAG: hypothetical protein PHF63_04730, partial [Herbinix sp.]|nr:hypothetical protein [Herbinix sp.]